MSRPLVGPRSGCALHGALLTATAIEGIVPLVHSTPGCALRAALPDAIVSSAEEGAPTRLPPISSTNLADKHIVFGGTSRLREQIKNTLSVLPGRLLVVLTGCPTEMIGDDVAAMVKEVTSQGEAVIEIAAAGFRGPAHHGYELMLSGLIAQSDILGPAPVPGSRDLVNVFGIVPRQDSRWVGELDEIARIIDAIGLRANVLVGPSGGLDGVRALAQARASLVLSPWGEAPARALQDRFGIPIARIDGIPIGFDAVTTLVERLHRALGTDPGERAVRFLSAERRHEDFIVNEALDALAALGRRRFAIAAGSSVAGPLARFLKDTLGWAEAAVIVTDDPPADTHAVLSVGHERISFISDGAEIAGTIKTSGADFLFASRQDRAALRDLNLPFVRVSGRDGLDGLRGGLSGARGAARLLDEIVKAAAHRG